MPLLRADLTPEGELAHIKPILTAAASLPPEAPIIVMIHGYRYVPGRPGRCPHRHILSLQPDPRSKRAASWPRHLGIGRSTGPEPLCIALGWPAGGSIWRANAHADIAGAALARMAQALRMVSEAPVQVFAHSLGARVALRALALTRPGTFGRMILLSAAALRPLALTALAASERTEIVNVTSRENDLFDQILELACISAERSVGTGLGRTHPRWLDLQIDDADTLAALARLGFPTGTPLRRICHWSGYLRPGLFALYRSLLATSGALPLAGLRDCLPAEATPRWSRLIPRLELGWLRPVGRRAA